MDSFVVFDIAVWCYLVFSFLFLPFSFSEVKTASEMTKTMLEWVFYLLILQWISQLVNMWNWPEQLMLSVNQKIYIK